VIETIIDLMTDATEKIAISVITYKNTIHPYVTIYEEINTKAKMFLKMV
jgi:hypothetical protein